MSRNSGYALALAMVFALAAVGRAEAQDDWWEEGDTGSEETASSEEEEFGDEDGDEAAESDEDEDEEDQGGDDAPRTWHFGPWFRFALIPAFIPQLFLDEAPTVAGPAFGLNATMRGESVNLVFGLGYTSYAFEDPFLSKGDPDTDTEWVESNLGLVHATVSILWDTDISEQFAFEYGIGADVGIVTGDMVRTEAYATPGGGYAPCIGVGNPNILYCEGPPVAYDEVGAHYGVVEERVPPVAIIPMIPHLALRYTPTNEWTVKAEMAYGIIQFWFGLSASFAPDI